MPNNFNNYIYPILGNALLTLREKVSMPRLVNSDFSSETSQRGNTINLSVPQPTTTEAVTASAADPASGDLASENVSIVLDQHRRAKPFVVTDKEKGEIAEKTRVLPSQFDEAIRAIANEANSTLMQQCKGIYGYAGSSAAIPFSANTKAAVDARKVLNQQNCPTEGRVGYLDYEAEAAFLEQGSLADVDKTGENGVKIEGNMGRKYGVDWFAGTGHFVQGDGNNSTGWLVNQVGHAINDTTVTIDTGTNNPEVGDIFTVAGDKQTYVVTNYAANVITYSPKAKTAFADDAVITFVPQHSVNVMFHPNAFAFAQRQLPDSDASGASIFRMSDPMTSISLRLEIKRQNAQDQWILDVLYGVKLVRPELACRIIGTP